MAKDGQKDLSQQFQKFISKHPVFLRASSFLKDDTVSLVKFEGDDQDYEWLKLDGENICRPGNPEKPDLYFRFSSGAVSYLNDIQTSDIGEFMIRMFECILTKDPEKKIDFRIVSNFRRLASTGHINLLLKSGPKTATFAAKHGVKSIGDLRRKLKDFM